jgi:hypothetical protein
MNKDLWESRKDDMMGTGNWSHTQTGVPLSASA